MRRILATCAAILGGAVLTQWIKSKSRKHPGTDQDEWIELSGSGLLAMATIDDDTAADIIKRALPAMERAAKLDQSNEGSKP